MAARAASDSTLGQLPVSGPVGEESVVPNAVEAGRQHVEEHAADEFGRRQGHDLLAEGTGAPVVGVAKAPEPVAEAAQALVSDGDPVGVAAEVVEDLFGAGEGRLGVRPPTRSRGRVGSARRSAGGR